MPAYKTKKTNTEFQTGILKLVITKEIKIIIAGKTQWSTPPTVADQASSNHTAIWGKKSNKTDKKFSKNCNNQKPGLELSTSLCNLLPSVYCCNSFGGRNIPRIICGKHSNYLLTVQVWHKLSRTAFFLSSLANWYENQKQYRQGKGSNSI